MNTSVIAVDEYEPAADTDASTVPEPANKVSQTMEPPARKKSSGKLRGFAEKSMRAILLPGATFIIVGFIWTLIHMKISPQIPSLSDTWQAAISVLSDPFYKHGPNDLGIGWQILYSLGRVMAGFSLAAVVGIPVGFMMGMSANIQRAWQPLIQILRPVSPLAWLPIGLLLFKAANPSAIFVIFITSIWPMIINTAAGVKAIPQDYMNVAAVLRLGRLEITRKILLPATLPHVITGMRLSLNIAWMVIVAAEMLTGGVGIGFWLWDEWNNLNIPHIIVAIVLIGIVGIVLESGMSLLQSRFDYSRK
ncbi:MAG: nitrate ABC transporter permease [Sideroxydans sp.]|nr:nitrate ABC transporter permease [Sideroxydans sp.]